jgi:hypothetical protein
MASINDAVAAKESIIVHGRCKNMISKTDALCNSGLASHLVVKRLENQIDEEIKRWRGGRIIIQLDGGGITAEVVGKCISPPRSAALSGIRTMCLCWCWSNKT